MSGWNGSQSKATSATTKSPTLRGAGKPSSLRGLVAGGLVVAIAIGAWFVFSSKPEVQNIKPEARAKKLAIAETKPSVAKQKPQEPAKPEKPKLSPTQVMGKRGIPIETYGLKTYWTNGVLRYEGGLRVYDPNRPSKKLELRPPEPEIFKRHSLNSIASVISHEPGDLLVGDIEYGEDFVKDFNDSLAEPIEYDEKDTEYTRQVKDAVKEVQKSLHDMMNRGEDIAQAMTEARADLRNLSVYRQEIMAMVSESADNEEAADTDVEDIIQAANQMFREKGVKEIQETEIVRWNLIMDARREKAEKSGAELKLGTTVEEN